MTVWSDSSSYIFSATYVFDHSAGLQFALPPAPHDSGIGAECAETPSGGRRRQLVGPCKVVTDPKRICQTIYAQQ